MKGQEMLKMMEELKKRYSYQNFFWIQAAIVGVGCSAVCLAFTQPVVGLVTLLVSGIMFQQGQYDRFKMITQDNLKRLGDAVAHCMYANESIYRVLNEAATVMAELEKELSEDTNKGKVH